MSEWLKEIEAFKKKVEAVSPGHDRKSDEQQLQSEQNSAPPLLDTVPFGAPLAKLDEIPSLAMRSGSLLGSVQQMATEIDGLVQQHAQTIRDEMSVAKRHTDDPHVIEGITQAADLEAEQQAKLFRDGLLKDQRGVNLDSMIRQLHDTAERLKNCLAANPNTQAMLDRVGNSEPAALDRKIKLAAWLADAGPAEVANTTRRALLENDLVTLAACARALAKLPKNLRPEGITPQTIADRIYKQEHDAIRLASQQADLNLQKALNVKRSIVLGRRVVSPTGRIAHGLSQRAVTNSIPDTRTANEKIAAGLSAIAQASGAGEQS